MVLSLRVVRVERHLVPRGTSRESILISASECLLVGNDDVNDFEVFNNGVQVGEVDATACEIAALDIRWQIRV